MGTNKKKKGKPPAFQFYVGDWNREVGLKSADVVVRGGWAEILFTMHDATPRGKVGGTLEDLANIIRAPIWGEHHEEYNPWDPRCPGYKVSTLYIIRELIRRKVCDWEFREGDSMSEELFCPEYDPGLANGSNGNDHVFEGVSRDLSRECHTLSHFCHANVTLINRRMFGEWERKNSQRIRQQRCRKSKAIQTKKTIGHADVTPYSSSSIKKKKKDVTSRKQKPQTKKLKWTKDLERRWERFWNVWPKKVGKIPARTSFLKLNPNDAVVEDMIKGIKERIGVDDNWRDPGLILKYCPNPSTWINNQRWTDDLMIGQQKVKDYDDKDLKVCDGCRGKFLAVVRAHDGRTLCVACMKKQ